MHSVDGGVDAQPRETAHSELQSENARLQLLLNLTNRITSNLELHDLLRAISANIREVMHCEAVAIYLADSASGSFSVHAVDYLVSRLTAEDNLLLIDDVFDSGRSLEAAIGELSLRCRRNMPTNVRIATVYYKPSRNKTSIVPDYHVRATDEWLVFPHELRGLTREEILANKPLDESFFKR